MIIPGFHPCRDSWKSQLSRSPSFPCCPHIGWSRHFWSTDIKHTDRSSFKLKLHLHGYLWFSHSKYSHTFGNVFYPFGVTKFTEWIFNGVFIDSTSGCTRTQMLFFQYQAKASQAVLIKVINKNDSVII